MLDDGSYAVMVVDAEERPDGQVACDITLLDGPGKGDVVTVLADLTGDALDLLAVPGTLTVTDGQPHLTLEP